MPAHAPVSIDMLQTVRRSSIVMPRMAEPAYSMTWPLPPLAPILAMIAQDGVLGRDAGGALLELRR
jgi:hypothetical protein